MSEPIKYRLPDASGIYEIANTISGRKYIGSAVSIQRRSRYHRYRLNRGDHPNPAMQAAWRKYGELIFSIRVIELVPAALLLVREQHWLDTTKAASRRDYYNVLPIAGSHYGVKRSAATRRRLSVAMKGRTFSPETKAKMRAAKLGRKLTAQHRARIGDAARGKSIKRPEGIINQRLRKFTPDQVREIRRRKSEGWSYSRLCREYGTCTGPLYRIVHFQAYRDVA